MPADPERLVEPAAAIAAAPASPALELKPSALAVATGMHSEAELRAAGADRVVRDLADTSSLLAWLMADAAAPGEPA